MSSAIAKKYVNALMSSCNDSELAAMFNLLNELVCAFKMEKLNNIILSPDIASKEKVSLVLSLVEQSTAKSENFIKILGENDRLSLIPVIVQELKYQLSLKNNTYEGAIVSNFEISPTQVSTLEANFSQKFNAQIKLHNTVTAYPGIKIQLDDLGVEVSFSLERLKAQMSEHILKAI
ncbi:MAG: F0F1 ATP synthase subunit delta [Sulfurospirillaceae bacterium]|nr:F0F1 ATP synthase subunit delta [Sulfurospirillaceae bacterium]